MTTRENTNSPACVIKTSKSVRAQMMLPMWNRERHGLTMPTDKADLYERSLSNHNPVRELSQFRRDLMFNRPGAVLYNGTALRQKATFIENLDRLKDKLRIEKVRNNLHTCDNELGERLLRGNIIVDNANLEPDQLRMKNTVLMNDASVGRGTFDNCVIGGDSNIYDGDHKNLSTGGEMVIIHGVNIRNSNLYGTVIVTAEPGTGKTIHGYHLAADGTLNSNPNWGTTGDVPDKVWRRAVHSASICGSRDLETFCLNNNLHRTKDDTTCKCGYALPLALAGHPAAISYLLHRAKLYEHIPAEYAGMTEEQMLAELEGIFVYANPVCSDTLIIMKNGKRTYTSIRNLEDWKNLIRTEYGLEDVQALYNYHYA